MDEGDIPWKGVPSASDAWPFALDIAKFEARRAVGQMARNLLGIYGHYAATHETPPANITLLYARAAKYHSEMTNQVLKELVAEARAGGASWSEIGAALDVGATAAQKRFGKGLTGDEVTQLQKEAFVVLHSEYMEFTRDEETEYLLESVDGATPAERVFYAFARIKQAHEQFEALSEEIDSNVDAHLIAGTLIKIRDIMFSLLSALLADPEQWEAVSSWSAAPVTAAESNYFTPAAYLYWSMQQVILANDYIIEALAESKTDFGATLRLYLEAKQVIDQIMFVMMRDDIHAILPRVTEDGEPLGGG
ncbi:hypothetical protein [Streptomyces sp. NBC_01236]|uniref:hypothetical protein n=1 Tax=Streptomyces sp. NBC_01236 TaxID=2903789 RepID=UPI002E0EA534|nr:hypothetical protein OG324_14940 [Streptomyces sp. NBC_01236]